MLYKVNFEKVKKAMHLAVGQQEEVQSISCAVNKSAVLKSHLTQRVPALDKQKVHFASRDWNWDISMDKKWTTGICSLQQSTS